MRVIFRPMVIFSSGLLAEMLSSEILKDEAVERKYKELLYLQRNTIENEYRFRKTVRKFF